MFNHNQTYRAVKRLIDSVWTVQFLFTDEGVHIISYSRDDEVGYVEEKRLPKAIIVEDENRIARSIKVFSPETILLEADRDDHLIGEYNVLNPKFIFSYKDGGQR
ncbi:hypothetical protein OKZ62_001747 [Vibrio navarrensis]|nr:hypothetical protein [Vibrio navarrensis]